MIIKQVHLVLGTIKGNFKMCILFTQHNTTNVSSFEGMGKWHAAGMSTRVVAREFDVCVFPNHVQSIEFTTGGLQLSCRNISRMINGNNVHLSSISSLIAKGLNTYAKMSMGYYGVLCVD